MTVHIVIDHVAVNRLLFSPTGAVVRDALRRGRAVRALARRLAPRRTGALAASIEVSTRFGVRGVSILIGSNLPHARVAHDGRRAVRARRRRALAFTVTGGEVVFAASARGAPGTSYLTNALRAAR